MFVAARRSSAATAPQAIHKELLVSRPIQANGSAVAFSSLPRDIADWSALSSAVA